MEEAAGPAGGVTYTVIGCASWEPWSLRARPLVWSVYGGFIGTPMESVSDGPPPLNSPLWSLKVGCEAGGQNNADIPARAIKTC